MPAILGGIAQDRILAGDVGKPPEVGNIGEFRPEGGVNPVVQSMGFTPPAGSKLHAETQPRTRRLRKAGQPVG